MTPAELLALADAATPGPGDTPPYSWTGARAGEKMVASARLIALAPDLARLCAEMGEALRDLEAEGWFASWSDDPRVLTIRAALAKLSELEPR